MMYHDCRLSARESAPSVDSTGQHDYTQRRMATVLLDVVRHRGLRASIQQLVGGTGRSRDAQLRNCGHQLTVRHPADT